MSKRKDKKGEKTREERDGDKAQKTSFIILDKHVYPTMLSQQAEEKQVVCF